MNKEEEKLLSIVSAWIKGKQIGTIYIARDEGVYNKRIAVNCYPFVITMSMPEISK